MGYAEEKIKWQKQSTNASSTDLYKCPPSSMHRKRVCVRGLGMGIALGRKICFRVHSQRKGY